MGKSHSQQGKNARQAQAKSFGYDDLSEVGKCIADYYRRVESLPIPSHHTDAIAEWMTIVRDEEHAFLLEEGRKLKERITGGKVLQALTLSKEEWNTAKQEENAKLAPGAYISTEKAKLLYEAQQNFSHGVKNVNNMSLMTKLERAARDAMSAGDYEKAMKLMVEKKKLEWNEKFDVETDMHRTNVAYVMGDKL